MITKAELEELLAGAIEEKDALRVECEGLRQKAEAMESKLKQAGQHKQAVQVLVNSIANSAEAALVSLYGVETEPVQPYYNNDKEEPSTPEIRILRHICKLCDAISDKDRGIPF